MKRFILLIQLCFLLGFGAATYAASDSAADYTIKQGQIVVVKIPADDSIKSVEGVFSVKDAKGKVRKRDLRFFPNSQTKQFVGLLGIDMKDDPGTQSLKITVDFGSQVRTLNYTINIEKENFRVENLTVPEGTGAPSPATNKRLTNEQNQVLSVFAVDSLEKLWNSKFVAPVKGRQTGAFGSYRVINGSARQPHNGEDIAAKSGTDVLATNDGTVKLTVNHFFSGKGVFVDHGLGLYSMYFHLSEILVKDGEFVRAGQVIGKVGMTGRATGPHLHWGVKLNGAYVNPFGLLNLN